MARLRSASILALLVALLWPAYALASAPHEPPTTAPCYTAALRALTKQGAIYSQGGVLAGDPVNPSTGQPYPRTGPNSFDCSGLVWWAYAQAGVTIGSTTYQQLNNGVPINCTLADLAGVSTSCWTLGDLILLRYTGGQHVAIYVGRGLFMDCYNHATGCILHDVTTDSFYRAHFYQARRIVSGCESLTNDPGQPLPPSSGESPQLELLPALLAPVQLVIPLVCGSCAGGIPALMPLPVPAVSWLDLGSWFPWLTAQLWNVVALPILCWLITLAHIGAALLEQVVNSVFVAGVNGLWRLLLFALLWLSSLVQAGWAALADLRGLVWAAWSSLVQLGQQLAGVITFLQSMLTLAGAVLVQLALLLLSLLQPFLYLLSLMTTLIPALLTAFTSPTAPPQLAGVLNYFLFVWLRDTLQAIADSKLSWAWASLIALFYLRFALWLLDELSHVNE